MKSPTKFLLVFYQSVPELLVRSLAFFIIGFGLVASFALLSIRPAIREIRAKLSRSRT